MCTAGVLLDDYILTKVNDQVMEIISWSENPIWVWWVEHSEWKYTKGEKSLWNIILAMTSEIS